EDHRLNATIVCVRYDDNRDLYPFPTRRSSDLFRVEPERRPGIDEGEEGPPMFERHALAHPARLAGGDAGGLHHGAGRDRVDLVGDAAEEGALERDGGGDGEHEARSDAPLRLDLHRAAEPDHFLVDGVQADAAPGALAQGGGGDARLEDQRLGIARVVDAGLLRPPADGLLVDAGAVVLHLDDDLAAVGGGAAADPSHRGLAPLLALLGRLDPVDHGVAHHVAEDLAQAIEDRLVDLHVRPDDVEFDPLAVAHRLVADETPVADEEGTDGHGAQAEDQ